MSDDNRWEFHFRNFDSEPHYFGVYHSGCGGAPWKMGRPNCWYCQPTNNPDGGDNSVYVPSDFIAHYGAWLQVIIDVIKEISDLAAAVASEGEDADAWVDAVSDAFQMEQDIVKAQLANSGVELETLMERSQAVLEASAQAIGQTAESITQIANNMGLGSGWAFVAGDAYQKMITNDNDEINEGYGWSILKSEIIGQPITALCNHAFISEGHLILYWNSQDSTGFWVPHDDN